ncbi:MAG TPA: poly(A) polymerase, partial [Vicinamibacteria bacterium]
PKDFDIGTSAHPQQVKKLFRNCFVIGRRFRLCHVRFGRKVVEVSTFRRQAPPEEGDTLIRRDNTFGSPEEDAFRRDFTVNALFYDIASFSIIDYIEGLPDLEHKVIRTIGDPAVRFREDPVRMLRAVALAARLDFTIDRDTLEAIRFLRGDIVKSSPARVLEEVYKVLRQGASRKTFQMLHEVGLLAYILPEADQALTEQGEALLGSLSRLDDYRNAGLAAAEQLTNPLILGTLLVPLGVPLRRGGAPRRAVLDELESDAEPIEPQPRDDLAAEMALLGAGEEIEAQPGAPPLSLLFARRDLDRLRLLLAAQTRLRELRSSPRVRQLLAGRGYIDEALRWMEIHGGVQGQELAAYWRSLDLGDVPPPASLSGPVPETPVAEPPPRRPRRRRRRRSRPRPPVDARIDEGHG